MRRRKREEKRAAEHGDGDQSNKDEGASHCRGEADGDVSNGHHPPAPAKSDGIAAAEGGGDGGAGVTSGSGGLKDGRERKEEEELTKHTPEVRTAIYREMAEQKKEKEDRQRENLPKDRNFELEQVSTSVERRGGKSWPFAMHHSPWHHGRYYGCWTNDLRLSVAC